MSEQISNEMKYFTIKWALNDQYSKKIAHRRTFNDSQKKQDFSLFGSNSILSHE